MDARTAGSEPAVDARRADGRQGDAGGAAEQIDEALLARLDRVVALAHRRHEPARHGELLDELRGLVRAAEELTARQPRGAQAPAAPQVEEVVERPARRLHGT